VTNLLAPDQAARDRILEPLQSFIVQAPAGSGKTELLTQRFLMLLAYAEKAPEEIIAITFTRKAAAEMRARVLASLNRAMDDNAPKDKHAQKTWELARAALAKDQQFGWNILNNSQRLKITTIDSLCASLVQKMPIVSTLGSPPQVSEDLSLLYREAIGLLIKDWGRLPAWHQEMNAILRHLDNQLEWFERLMVEMLRRREQWLDVVEVAAKQNHLREILEYSLQAAAVQILHNVQLVFPIELEAEFFSLVQHALSQLQIGEIQYLNTQNLTDLKALSTWRAVADVMLDAKGEWRKSVTVRQGFPAGETKAEKVECKAIKERMHALLKTLAAPGQEEAKRYEAFKLALSSIKTVKAVVYQEVQWQIVKSLLVILPVAVDRLKQLFAEQAMVDFNEISLAALKALGNEDEPSELALSLDYRIRHLLIDEFQDTSQLQFQLLQALTRGWEPGDGRSLFLVGDPMQSIYRFRQADVSLFIQAKNYGVGNITLEYVQLTANFRSDQAVIDWVNKHFVDIFPMQDDMVKGAVSYRTSIATRQYEHSEVQFIPVTSPQDEALLLTEKVKALLMQSPMDNIAILVRSRSHLQSILPVLHQAGVCYQAVEIESIFERLVIRDLISLTYALLHLGDRLSWMAILRAPWCGLSLHDLSIIAEYSKAMPIWQALLEPKVLTLLSSHGQASLNRIVPILAKSLAEQDRFGLRQWLELTWWSVGGPQCLTDAMDLENAESYFELVEAFNREEGLPSREVLEQQLLRLKAKTKPTAKAPVQIMTIHKSKGLEFDTVFIPGLGKGERADTPPLLLWESYPLPSGEHGLLMAPIKSRSISNEPIYDFIKETNQARKYYESQRLLYVAVTRAKKRLYLLGQSHFSEKHQAFMPRAKSFLSLLWPHVKNELYDRSLPMHETLSQSQVKSIYGQLARLKSPEHIKTTSTDLLPNMQSGSIENKPIHNIPDLGSSHFDSRAIGTLVHRYLAEIANQGLLNWHEQTLERFQSKWRQELRHMGMAESLCDNAVKNVHSAIAKILQDPNGQWILEHKEDSKVELALVCYEQGRCKKYIIDRTFIDEHGARWIIDYKTSQPKLGEDLEQFMHEQKQLYQTQLETYAKTLNDKKVLYLGLYFPMVPSFLSWQYEEELK